MKTLMQIIGVVTAVVVLTLIGIVVMLAGIIIKMIFLGLAGIVFIGILVDAFINRNR
jgi:hypothetical protein